MNYFLKLIGEIENELLSSGTAIWSKRVDIEKCLSLIEKIKKTLPKIMEEADIIVSEKERILEDARFSARQIIDDAERQAYSAVNMNTITMRAESMAEELRQRTEYNCKRALSESQERISSMYEGFESYVLELLNTAREKKDMFMPSKASKNTTSGRSRTAQTRKSSRSKKR